jgi:hypothetical protein
MCVTEADFERIMGEFDHGPFKEKVYSIDDVTIGIDVSPDSDCVWDSWGGTRRQDFSGTSTSRATCAGGQPGGVGHW